MALLSMLAVLTALGVIITVDGIAECPLNAHADNGQCFCDAGFEPNDSGLCEKNGAFEAAELSFESLNPLLRFQVGDRVSTNFNGGYIPGVVTIVNDEGHPYRIKLADGKSACYLCCVCMLYGCCCFFLAYALLF